MIAARHFFTSVRALERYIRLYCRRRSLTRARLAADNEFAILKLHLPREDLAVLIFPVDKNDEPRVL